MHRYCMYSKMYVCEWPYLQGVREAMAILEADCPSEFLLLESKSNQGGSVAVDTAAEKGEVRVTINSLAKLRSHLRTAIIRYRIAMSMKEVRRVVHTYIHTII